MQRVHGLSLVLILIPLASYLFEPKGPFELNEAHKVIYCRKNNNRAFQQKVELNPGPG